MKGSQVGAWIYLFQKNDNKFMHYELLNSRFLQAYVGLINAAKTYYRMTDNKISDKGCPQISIADHISIVISQEEKTKGKPIKDIYEETREIITKNYGRNFRRNHDSKVGWWACGIFG